MGYLGQNERVNQHHLLYTLHYRLEKPVNKLAMAGITADNSGARKTTFLNDLPLTYEADFFLCKISQSFFVPLQLQLLLWRDTHVSFEYVERAIANTLDEVVTCTFKDILSHLLVCPGKKFERRCVTSLLSTRNVNHCRLVWKNFCTKTELVRCALLKVQQQITERSRCCVFGCYKIELDCVTIALSRLIPISGKPLNHNLGVKNQGYTVKNAT